MVINLDRCLDHLNGILSTAATEINQVIQLRGFAHPMRQLINQVISQIGLLGLKVGLQPSLYPLAQQIVALLGRESVKLLGNSRANSELNAVGVGLTLQPISSLMLQVLDGIGRLSFGHGWFSVDGSRAITARLGWVSSGSQTLQLARGIPPMGSDSTPDHGD